MSGGGAHAPPPKQEELLPHPVKDQLPGVSFCITSPPPWPEAILLGFQHYLVMLGTTVLIPSLLVPQMGGGKEEKALMIQTLQFVAGLNTMTQTLFGTRLPAVIGGSYTYLPATLSIVLAGRYSGILFCIASQTFSEVLQLDKIKIESMGIVKVICGSSNIKYDEFLLHYTTMYHFDTENIMIKIWPFVNIRCPFLL